MSGGLRTHLAVIKCTVCEKEFCPAPYHAYKDARRFHPLVCSYHCSRESERLLAELRARTPQKKRGPKKKGGNENA